jgi:hypothetical protein
MFSSSEFQVIRMLAQISGTKSENIAALPVHDQTYGKSQFVRRLGPFHRLGVATGNKRFLFIGWREIFKHGLSST